MRHKDDACMDCMKRFRKQIIQNGGHEEEDCLLVTAQVVSE